MILQVHGYICDHLCVEITLFEHDFRKLCELRDVVESLALVKRRRTHEGRRRDAMNAHEHRLGCTICTTTDSAGIHADEYAPSDES